MKPSRTLACVAVMLMLVGLFGAFATIANCWMPELGRGGTSQQVFYEIEFAIWVLVVSVSAILLKLST